MSLATLRLIGAAVSVCALVSACGGGGSDAPAPTPTTITAQPQNQSVMTGSTATFSVSATGSNLTYQWQRNGVAIGGAMAAAYTTPAAASSDNGAQYTVVVSGAGGNVTSGVAQITLQLSANQQVYENLAVGPTGGSYVLGWNLNLTGPEASGTNFLFSTVSTPPLSPLTNGPQATTDSVAANMTQTLALPTFTPTRILKNGTVLVVPAIQVAYRVSYVGADVQVDTLASDNATVAFSQLRTDYSATALSGPLAASPSEFARFYNSVFANPAVLASGASYAAGAGYVKATALNRGDRYNALDCTTATTGANITPCLTGTTIAAGMTAGIASASDATTYHLADGVTGTVGGIPVWVATSPRPQSATLSSTVQYRVYFELNGNVYTAVLIKDGATVGGSYYVSNPAGATVIDRLTFLPYQIRMNKAARDSIAAAVTF